MNIEKSRFASKINWTAAVSMAVTLGTVFGVDIEPELQAKIAASVSTVAGTATIVWRTWLTSKTLK